MLRSYRVEQPLRLEVSLELPASLGTSNLCVDLHARGESIGPVWMLDRTFAALHPLSFFQSLQIGACLARGHAEVTGDLGSARVRVLAKEVDDVLLSVLARSRSCHAALAALARVGKRGMRPDCGCEHGPVPVTGGVDRD